MGSDYSNHEHCTGFPPTHPADLPWLGHGGSESPGPIPRASHFVDQHSGAEQNYGFGPYGEDRTGFLDSGVAGRSYETASGIDLAFDISQATPIVSDEAVVTGPTDTISPPPAAMVGNRGATQAPAELSPMGVNNLEIKRSGRRKRSASPDGRDKGKHTQRKKRRHSSAREQPQVSLAGIGLTRKGVVTTVVLDSTDCYTLAHAHKSLRGETDRVPTTKCTEQPATSAFDQFRGLGGRAKARRDQSRRCLEQTL